jgi:hypothetical protein
MTNVDKAAREAVAREVAPLMAQCERLRTRIDHAEDLSWIPDRHDRAFARVEVMMLRAELEAIVCNLQSDRLVEEATRLARERWPSWRI